jgi:hypothetical protein
MKKRATRWGRPYVIMGIMTTTRIPRSRLILQLACWLALSLGACTPRPTATVFIPPSDPTATIAPNTPLPSPTALPVLTITETSLATTVVACENDISFIQDLTVPDGSVISPGGAIDKQWLVENSGTCNWDSGYRFKLVAGEALGALTEQALYPAKAGTQATLRVLFTAPAEPGIYQSAWQAFAPDGTMFGDAVFIQIVVE